MGGRPAAATLSARDQGICMEAGSPSSKPGAAEVSGATRQAQQAPRPGSVTGRAVGADVLQELRLACAQRGLELDLQAAASGRVLSGWHRQSQAAHQPESCAGYVRKGTCIPTDNVGRLARRCLPRPRPRACCGPATAAHSHASSGQHADRAQPALWPLAHLRASGGELIQQRLDRPVAGAEPLPPDARRHHNPAGRGGTCNALFGKQRVIALKP